MFNIASFITVLVAGITFSWDGWFAEETAEAHVQEVIDNLINIVFFIFFG
jgi:NhaP-type Na+/H+ or K+/H+ antiporter